MAAELVLFSAAVISSSIAAPDARRIVEKVAASTLALPKASLHSTEFIAKATSARRVHTKVLVGLAGSSLIEAGLEAGLRVASEGFPDRNYNPDGTLVSRKQANAIIESSEEIAAHAVKLAQQGIDIGGRNIRIDTLCLHGDHPSAAQNAKLVREALEKSGIDLLHK